MYYQPDSRVVCNNISNEFRIIQIIVLFSLMILDYQINIKIFVKGNLNDDSKAIHNYIFFFCFLI